MLRWAWQRSRTRGLFSASEGTPPAHLGHQVRQPRAADGECAITWVGHSTFLVQVGGLNILTDSVWSERCAPVQWAGPRRHVAPGIPFSELPPIDVVLQSHDHYDHFDDWSVRAMARATLMRPGSRRSAWRGDFARAGSGGSPNSIGGRSTPPMLPT